MLQFGIKDFKRLIYRIYDIDMYQYVHIIWRNESKSILAFAIDDRGGGEVERV